MTSGYILIVAILILGGVIATVGDRLGSRVGKARLTLFNLRPRQTAVVITILTGGIISASTLAILFAISDQLRTGVFELGRIQDNLSKARKELEQARLDKGNVEVELTQARKEQTVAQQRLNEINTEKTRLETAKAKTEAQLKTTQGQLGTVSRQATVLRTEISRLQQERQALLVQQSRVRAQIAQRDEEIAKRNQVILENARRLSESTAQLQTSMEQLNALEAQQTSLRRDVQALYQSYQYYQRQYESLARGRVALFRGQVLASGVVRIVTPPAARQAVDQLLREANRNAVQLTLPGAATNQQTIQITKPEVENLIRNISDGRDYVLQVLSAGNYVTGSQEIQVVANATLNQVVFRPGEVVASTTLDLSSTSEEEIRESIQWLITASEFRGRRLNILAEGVQVGNDSSILPIINFIEQLKQHNESVDLQALAADTIYTAGPLKIQLVAIQNGKVLFKAG